VFFIIFRFRGKHSEERRKEHRE